MGRGDFGFNGYLASTGIGKRKIRAIKVTLKMSIIATADSEARDRRAFYPVVTTGSSFDLTLGFVSWSEREQFTQWLTQYLIEVSRGTAANGVMTLSVPSRKIMNTCVPSGEIQFGEGVNDVAYYMTIPFSGASDPVDTVRDPGSLLSRFKPPQTGFGTSQYFYPEGRQISGAGNLDGTIFDTAGGGYTPYEPETTDGGYDLNLPPGVKH